MKLSKYSETMALAFMVWLCSLPLIALFILPFFGWQTAVALALMMLVVLLMICWALCGRAI
jgi:hypothetical protein